MDEDIEMIVVLTVYFEVLEWRRIAKKISIADRITRCSDTRPALYVDH